jgi:hypothetical protein
VAQELSAQETHEGAFRIPHSLLPDKYRDPELSGLIGEVKAGQENLIDFHLE